MILLVRHGETDDNCPPVRVQGHLDVPLNERGREQARELAERIAAGPETVMALYCSHLARAHETARVIGARLGLEPVVDERFAESRRGEWEGRTLDEIARGDPSGYAAWLAAGERFRFPGGESLREQMERVAAALVDVRQGGRLPALVVCHGGTIRAALCHAHSRGLDAFHDFEVPNGALIRL
jgi:broad specificity phosphatase PhoE